MQIVQKMGAQGDVLFRRVKSMPDGVKPVERQGDLVVAHSETGHHHVIRHPAVMLFEHPTDPLVSFVRVPPKLADSVDVEHLRPFDTHETLRLLNETESEVIFEIRRQREYVPEGWRRVED